MSKTLYPPSEKPILAVLKPTPDQAQAIFDWAKANGAATLSRPDQDEGRLYFGIDRIIDTWWSNDKNDFQNNILTFEEFAELTGVEVKP